MKTAMQEFIKILESMINNGGDDDLFPAVEHAKALLRKEKFDIIPSFKNMSDKELIIDFIKYAKSKKHMKILDLKVYGIIDDYLKLKESETLTVLPINELLCGKGQNIA